MSRNGPIGFSGARAQAQARRPLPDDPFTAPPTGQTAPPQWPPQYADPQAQPAPQPVFAHHPAAGQPNYAPQPAYAQQQPHAGYGQPPHQQDSHPQQQNQGYYFPQGQAEPYAPQAAAHQLPFESVAHSVPSFAPQAQQPQTAPRWPAQPDARGFDLGNYMPAAAPSFPPAEAQFRQAREAAHFQQAAEPAQHHGELDPAGLPGQHDAARFDSQHGYGESDADFDEILAEDEEQPRRGRRGMMIAAALVGAIGLGGALAYTYKTFIASSSGPAPRITASNSGPNKIKPVVPDGKSFPNTDKKLLNRLGEAESSNPSGRVVIGVPPPQSQQDSSDDRASDDPNAPRKVRIIPITPNAAPQGAVPVTTGSAPPKPAMVAVPGVTLENLAAPQTPPSAARAALPPQAPPRTAPQAPAVKMASAAPLPAAEPAAPIRKAAPMAPAAKEVVAKSPVPKTKTAAAQPAPVATSATGGYVAVLSSKKSRMDALKAFADMQQKYGDVLASKTPDVQEANLGDKGIWYRAVVGPPGSRDAAASLCSKLKTAGYSGCWVAPY